jgi:hypothetical protein
MRMSTVGNVGGSNVNSSTVYVSPETKSVQSDDGSMTRWAWPHGTAKNRLRGGSFGSMYAQPDV